jgi:hypothetical protein
MENAVVFVTITSKYPPGKEVGEIKVIDCPLPVHRRSPPSTVLVMKGLPDVLIIGTRKPEMHSRCSKACRLTGVTSSEVGTVRFGVVTVPVRLGFARGA